jgi:putative DNA primase/helicase
MEIIKTLDTYTEISPSGTGIRMFVTDNLLPINRKNGNIEIANHLKYFSLTGNHLEGTPNTIEARHSEIKEIYAEIFGTPGQTDPKVEEKTVKPVDLDDDAVLTKARAAKNGPLFVKLFDQGDIGNYHSHSEADLALCYLLSFWTGRDADSIDHLFRRSKLFRSKWDEVHVRGRTYGEETILKAIAGTKEVYNGKKERKTKTAKVFFSLTDLGNAERLVSKCGDDIRYCHQRGRWLLWTGDHWKWDETKAIERKAKLTVRSILSEAMKTDNNRVKDVGKHAIRSENLTRFRAMITLAQSEKGIPVLFRELDVDPWLIHLRNGTLDLRTGELREPRRVDMITRLIDVNYDRAAPCPVWINFLSQVMSGNQALITFLQRAVGYSLTGDIREQVLFFLYGRGANGKSTFIETITGLFGPYSKHTRPETFMAKKTDGPSNDLAELDGVRMVAAVELEEGRRLAEVLAKQVSGGDTMKARYLFQEFFEFRPQFKLWLCGNHKPRIHGTDHAIWRRIRLIPWTVTIPDDKQDKDLTMKLKAEWPGILVWAVEGCLDWQKNGLLAPDEVMAATADYRKEMDVLGDFFDACVTVEAGASVPAKDLYEAYCKFLDDNGENIRERLGKKKFNQRVADRGHDSYTGPGRRLIWIGIGLINDEQ